VPERNPQAVRWIALEDVDPPLDDLRYRGFKAGAARFARGEGIFWSDGALYMCCTDGGPDRLGQVYRILPRHFRDADPAVELFIQPATDDVLTNGDNLCAAPNGDLIICEDLISPHNTRRTPHVRGVTPDGRIFTIARNAKDRTEFAGSTFSPDGTILFLNMQSLGLTLAISGPWRT
jgi:secreted PhoX family phosphatase